MIGFFLKYYPSYHPGRGSRVRMTFEPSHICTGDWLCKGQNLPSCVPEPSQNLVPSYKHKTKENFKKMPASHFNEFEVLLFFKKNNWPEIESKKFYAYNRLKKFVLKDGKTKINWQTAADVFFKMGLE